MVVQFFEKIWLKTKMLGPYCSCHSVIQPLANYSKEWDTVNGARKRWG